MSIDTFGHSPSWTHDEMVAAGYVTDDDAQTLTPRGQLRIDLAEMRETAEHGSAFALLLIDAGYALDNLGDQWSRSDPQALRQLADQLRTNARAAESSGEDGWADVLSCTADTIDPETRGVGDPDPHPFARKPHRAVWAGCAVCGEVHA